MEGGREGEREREREREVHHNTIECCFVSTLGGSIICSAVFRLNAHMIGYTNLPYLA